MGARRIGLACALLIVACGAKTGLLLPGAGAGRSSGGGGAPTGPLALACNSALQSGAPTPMLGYCATRANQAAVDGPRAPQIAWTAQPFGPLNPEYYLPAEIVVDASGRAYVALDASPLNPSPSNRVAAVDAQGNVLWTLSFAGPVSDLAVGADGTLWVLGAGGADAGAYSTLTGIDASGATVTEYEPSLGDAGEGFDEVSYDSLAIGSDGSYFLGGPSAVTRLAGDGAPLWQRGIGSDGSQPLILTRGDELISGLTEIDDQGNILWNQDGFEGTPDVAGLDPNGYLVGLEDEGTGSPTLIKYDPAGQAQPAALLPQTTTNAFALAVAGDGTELVLLADELSAPGLTKAHLTLVAIGASGNTRWTTNLDVQLGFDPADLGAHYGLFVDAAGTVVVMAGTLTGVDLDSGSVLWTLEPPHTGSCLRPAVLGIEASIVALQCDGTLFLARDP